MFDQLTILFSCQFNKKFTRKTVVANYDLKLSMPMFLKCFFIFV